MLEKTDSATKNGKSRDTGKIGSKTQNEDQKKQKTKNKNKTKQKITTQKTKKMISPTEVNILCQ
jgi:hypothetical protein